MDADLRGVSFFKLTVVLFCFWLVSYIYIKKSVCVCYEVNKYYNTMMCDIIDI